MALARGAVCAHTLMLCFNSPLDRPADMTLIVPDIYNDASVARPSAPPQSMALGECMPHCTALVRHEAHKLLLLRSHLASESRSHRHQRLHPARRRLTSARRSTDPIKSPIAFHSRTRQVRSVQGSRRCWRRGSLGYDAAHSAAQPKPGRCGYQVGWVGNAAGDA